MPPDAGDANLSLPPDQARPPAAAPPDPGEEGTLKATQILHERGQSLWLDNITRGLLDSGQIQHYIDNYAVTGLTSSGRRPWCCAPRGPCSTARARGCHRPTGSGCAYSPTRE